MISKQTLTIILISAVSLAVSFIGLSLVSTNKSQAHPSSTLSHPDNPNCASCHADQWTSWNNSHHAKSMQVANEDTVLGNFDDQKVIINNHESHFYKKGDAFWVNTENKNYKIEYTFGIEPLQQYLIKMEDGKFQTLPLSWDSRPKTNGGQRWFHIYGEEDIRSNDRLHWQQPLQNWNGMCADCHSSGLNRNYDLESNSFKTSWDNINVGCVSCHGLNNDIMNTRAPSGGWSFVEGSHSAVWTGDKPDQREIGVCAACHSRRTPLTDGFSAEDQYLDRFLPTPIRAPEYFSDGQINDENYVWGSFLQSKMYAKGVTCSDCHDPHSLKLKADGNAMCTTCHQASYFDTTDHHKHKNASMGSQCVNCHMPARIYMGVDDRRDHSFRIPRPDLNHLSNSPDACTNCHKDKKPKWAANKITEWFGNNRPSHYGATMHMASLGSPEGEKQLNALINNKDVSEIITGSALEFLANYPNLNSYNAVSKALQSKDPLIRLGAIKASPFIPLKERTILLSPLLDDEFKAIRIEVIRALSDIDKSTLEGKFKTTYDRAKKEFLIAQQQVSWRGEGTYNLGLFHSGQNEPELAEKQYLKSIEIDPYFTASYINLADHYRKTAHEDLTIKTLERGLKIMPEDADLNFSKALFLIRKKRAPEALIYLKKAVKNAPENARYSYVYEIAKKQIIGTN